MSQRDNKFNSYHFILTSSSEVEDFVTKALKLQASQMLFQISAYMHNTVLVQNLKLQLQKQLPHAMVTLLKSENKSQAEIALFTSDEDFEGIASQDYFLKEMFKQFLTQSDEIKKNKTDLFKRYFTDNLTHLPNIYKLRKELEENDKAGLVVLNIDNFKTINNFYGFYVGDFVMEQVALMLTSKLSQHQIYRLSADEFAFILEENMGFYELKTYLISLYHTIKSFTVLYQENKIFVDMTLASCANITTKDIFSKVSMALKYAKENSLPFWIYEDRMHFENEYEKNLRVSSIVRHAVEKGKIIPYFQSIINNKTLKIEKYECLARLIDEKENVVSPTLFIPIAKKIKVYNLVTRTLIEKSFKAFEGNDFDFTINLSIEDIMKSEIFEFIITTLKTSTISHRVTFELLESEAIQDFQKVERFINEVKRYGAKIAIDDFGSGYSNFSYLTKIKVDYIKIDGSLIAHIDTDMNSLLVVETIVSFAKKLGVATIAEFVHSSTVLDKVKELGIDYSQGFYIDEPSVKRS